MRLGGDEFTLLFPDSHGGAWLLKTAEAIARRLSEPLEIEGHVFFVTVSIGIASAPVKDPIELRSHSGSLVMLARARDEAHRFANTYHQLLMKKRIGESILDDCPGVSQNRKNLLLRKFGSVNRLRKASVDEIAGTEGIGRKLAEDVHRFLGRH